MRSINPQAPSTVVMVRPHHFHPNPETRQDNSFQNRGNWIGERQYAENAYTESTNVAKQLTDSGITVHVFEGEDKSTPDCVFPNNWFSTHSGGHIAIYPMYVENRRKERRYDIIEMLKEKYRVQDVIDYSGLEQDDIFLEGTGAMVLDHLNRVAYAVDSKRTNPLALERFCAHFNFEPMLFEAYDSASKPIYHTNVLMCIGTEFVMIGLDMISNRKRREEIVQRFEESGRTVIALSHQQIDQFCGNAIELQGEQGRLLALSTTAFEALEQKQKELLEQSVKLLPLEVSTIESAGGSVRCMLAGIHLAAR